VTKEIQLYNFKGNDVRIVDRDGNPWFIAKDVCDELGIGNPSKALMGLELDEKSEIIVSPATRPINVSNSNSNINIKDLRPKKMRIINEPGLYKLIFRSRKPQAKAFKRWVTHEVLPSIRKTGAYVSDALSNEQLVTLAEGLLQRIKDNKKLVANNSLMICER